MTRAVESRLSGADLDTVRVVVREVVAAVARGSAPATRGLVNNGDGTVTTGLGARLPQPAAGQSPPSLCVGCVEQTKRNGRPRNRAV